MGNGERKPNENNRKDDVIFRYFSTNYAPSNSAAFNQHSNTGS